MIFIFNGYKENHEKARSAIQGRFPECVVRESFAFRYDGKLGVRLEVDQFIPYLKCECCGTQREDHEEFKKLSRWFGDLENSF